MSLEIGSRIAHYNVTALIGEGGMGQVYQATDTKLNRQVALKILPEAFATDPDRLVRFQREAQVLASLNHRRLDNGQTEQWTFASPPPRLPQPGIVDQAATLVIGSRDNDCKCAGGGSGTPGGGYRFSHSRYPRMANQPAPNMAKVEVSGTQMGLGFGPGGRPGR